METNKGRPTARDGDGTLLLKFIISDDKTIKHFEYDRKISKNPFICLHRNKISLATRSDFKNSHVLMYYNTCICFPYFIYYIHCENLFKC